MNAKDLEKVLRDFDCSLCSNEELKDLEELLFETFTNIRHQMATRRLAKRRAMGNEAPKLRFCVETSKD